MKIIQKKTLIGKKTVIVVAFILAIAIGVAGAYLWKTKTDQKISVNQSTQSADTTPKVNSLAPATDEQKAAGDQQKADSANSDTQSQDTPANTIGITITSFTQSSNQIQLRTLINTITNDGTCTLTVQSGASTITKTSGIQAMPSSSTCKGFSLTSDELPSGDWKATLNVSSGDKTGSTTKDLQVQ